MEHDLKRMFEPNSGENESEQSFILYKFSPLRARTNSLISTYPHSVMKDDLVLEVTCGHYVEIPSRCSHCKLCVYSHQFKCCN